MHHAQQRLPAFAHVDAHRPAAADTWRGDNGIDLDPATGAAGFAGQFARAGYATGFFGKAHFATKHTFAPTGTPECEFSMKNYPPDWHGPYMGFEHVELGVEGHNRNLPQKPPGGQAYEYWYYKDGLGDWPGDHGLILKGPMMYEGLLRVGMVFKGPGIPSGKVVADPVATTDLAATFYDYCGVDAGRELHSCSLRKLMDDRESRDYAYNEWRMHPSRTGLALDLRCVRTRDAKLILELGSGAGELYLLKDDPTEMDNRFGDPATAKLQKELTDMIHARPQDILSVLAEPIGMA